MNSALSRDLLDAQDWLRDWIFRCALPFWSGRGHEGEHGASEYLLLDGSHGGAAFKRMRVQARQIYAFSHAGLMGWSEGERLARHGYGFIKRCGERAAGGWVRRLSPAGDAVMDGAADLYDQAFVLLALAWFGRLSRDPAPLQMARRTAEWIHREMAAPHGGYYNVLPVEPAPRQQNPHMHLLEAMLALHETTGDDYYAAFATDLVALFHNRLFDSASGTLGEFFASDWSALSAPHADHVEPGHHFEWVCLLDQFEHQVGGALGPSIHRLYSFARTHGTDPGTGLVWDVVNRAGAPRQRSTRLWSQTEALKAHAVMARRGEDTAVLIPPLMRQLRTRFLAGCAEGGWIDQLDASGRPVSDKMPTSSFYHLFTAFVELDQLVSPKAKAPHRRLH